MVQIVPEFVPLTVNLTHVNTWTDRVLVFQVGGVLIVLQVTGYLYSCILKKILMIKKTWVMSMIYYIQKNVSTFS